jgi:tRNA threonylcarbamoyl adenosine modification protein YjeE
MVILQAVEYIGDLEKTKWLAKSLAKNAKAGDVFCLIGDLGAGKTEFSRAFIQELCGDVKVTSPTYNIVVPYQSQISNLKSQIYHFDLYRIKHPDELIEVGFTEALQNGLCLIEWPQIAEGFIPANAKYIKIEIVDESTRKITCS